MSSKRAQEILYESEAALRLVDNELHLLRTGEDDKDSGAVGGLSGLPAVLEQANSQILGVLERLRHSRSVLRNGAFQNLHSTHERIQEVNSVTEDAAIDILDACDRARKIVDELDAVDKVASPDRERATGLRGSLRDELFRMTAALQFQDIASQQLTHASALLVEMEDRLTEVARLFDPNVPLDTTRSSMMMTPAASSPAFDPDATTRGAAERQALADRLFTPEKQPNS